MIGLRLALGAIAVMALMTAGMGGLAVLDYQTSATQRSMTLLAGGDSTYWRALAAGAQAAAAEQGIELTIGWPPAHEDRCGRLSLAGTTGYTATCGNASHNAAQIFHVGEASFGAGRRCAEYVASLLQGGETILIIIDDNCRAAEPVERLQGFQQELKHPRRASQRGTAAQLEAVVVHLSADDVQAADRQISASISQHSARVVVDLRLGGAEELAAVVAELADAPQLVTFDQSDAAFKLMELGKIAAIVAHDPHLCGYLAVDRLAYFHEAGRLALPAEGKGHIYVPTQIVRPGEMAEFRASLK